MEILFVCSGNIVRSPLAHGLMAKVLNDIGVKNIAVSSAGTLGIEGRPAHPEAVRLARKRGFDLRKHRSRGLSPRDLARADMILVMEDEHLRAVRELDPAAGARARLLTEFEAASRRKGAFGIIDPIDGPREGFEKCFEIIDRCVANLAFELKYHHGS